jgi:hypothetical protein
MKIVISVREYDYYFLCKPDCMRLYGFSSVQKCTAALRCIAYGAPCDTRECSVILEAVANHNLWISMLSSEWRELTMTSTCYRGLLLTRV